MLSYQPYREAGHSQTYRTACNFIQTLTPNPAAVSEDASGLVCIKVGGIFFSSASRKVMAYPTDCARFPWQVDSRERHLEHFCGKTVAGGRQGDATWNTFAGKPWQVDGRERHLEHFCGKTVASGQRERTPGTLLQEFRARWAAEKATWNAFAGIPCQVDGKKRHLEHFCRNSVPGGRRNRRKSLLFY